MRSTALALALVLATGTALLGACGGGGSGGTTTSAPTPTPADIGTTYLAGPLPHLSDYQLFDITKTSLTPRAGVVPYDVNSPLFSDYALKSRTLWLPPKTSATYDPAVAFTFPVGTIISKTFAFPDNQAAPTVIRRIETRLLVLTDAGWVGNTYLWNDAQTDADLLVSGQVIPISFDDGTGTTLTASYLVPNTDQCKKCHENSDRVMNVIGLQARHLNRDFAYATGTENQLVHWTSVGYLAGAEAPDTAPRLPVWNDPSTGNVEQRARAWLEINCAHCHSEKGTSRTTGLRLTLSETDPFALGMCKPPVAAGKGSGGFDFDIAPGDPDHSILVFRLESMERDIQMPELGRSLEPTEPVALVRQWITELPSTACAGP